MHADAFTKSGQPLSAALAVVAARPTARATLAFLQFVLRPPDPPLPSGLLLRILDPADELVAGQRRYVPPGFEGRRVGDQRLAQICGERVNDPARHALTAAHAGSVAGARAAELN